MDKEFIQTLANIRKESFHEAYRWALSAELQSRGEEVTEAAIAAEALRQDPDALVANKVLYRNIVEAANSFGLVDNSIRLRMKREGETLEQAIASLNEFNKGIFVHGVRYDSVVTASKAYDVQNVTVYLRMRTKGETPEQAIDAIVKNKKGVVFHGRHYESLVAVSKAYNIGSAAIYQGIKRGLSLEQSVDAAITRRDRQYEAFGHKYPSIKRAAKENGVVYDTVFDRMNKYGDTLEQAITHLQNISSNRISNIVVHGKKFTTINALANHYGVAATNIKSRMKKWNETPEQAVDSLALPRLRRSNIIKHIVFGKTFYSPREAALAHGIEYRSLGYRINKLGETVEQAINHLLTKKGKRRAAA